MFIREITGLVIAALLLTGGVATASQVTEYGAQPAEELKIILTQEEARAIALNHAGLTEADVTWGRGEYEVERGTPEWDVDFRSGDWEYDYEIHAETGAVIKGEKEYDPVKVPAATQPAENKPAETQPPKEETPAAKKLTEEEAKAIVLKHAGVAEAEVIWERSEYEVERGIPEWDIDFRSGDWEYDYEVNAETGAVIKSEKEYDPVKAPTSTKPAETPKTETPKTEKLTAEEAKNAALKHAGLKASQVKGLRAEYDVDDGVPQWDVEFYADGFEYDYEIHAESGKIRSWDKDRDD
jgi:uncharacterized membrane protein YkoI